jgi:hypothetical protein
MLPTARVVDALRAFREAYPTVTLRLHVEGLGAVTQMVLERRATLGVAGPLDVVNGGDQLDYIAVGSTLLVPVAAPDHPLAQRTEPAGRGPGPHPARPHRPLEADRRPRLRRRQRPHVATGRPGRQAHPAEGRSGLGQHARTDGPRRHRGGPAEAPGHAGTGRGALCAARDLSRGYPARAGDGVSDRAVSGTGGIEPAAAALAARNADEAGLEAIRKGLARMQAAAQGEDDPLAADIAFHVAILDATKNPFYRELHELVNTALRISIRFTNRIKGRTASIPSHADVAEAIIARDAERASSAMREIIFDVLELIRAASPATESEAARREA